MTVGFVSLGCSKNLIDTEMAIGVFKENKFQIVNNVEEAEIIVVNTCGFIDKAKQEAIDTIVEMLEYKEKGSCKYIIAMGCLVQRYLSDLQSDLPEVDLFITIDNYKNFWEQIDNLVGAPAHRCPDGQGRPPLQEMDYLNRVITTGTATAYLKIAEGCSNKCTYCAIPYIRGPYISRPMEDILDEANKLAQNGIKEVIVIAQDTTKYGIDIYGKPKLAKLLEEICKIEGLEWIRFLYSYPESIDDELINVIKENNKICNYIDMPIQHVSSDVLKRMNRHVGVGSTYDPPIKYIENLIQNIRNQIPNVIIRTSLIVRISRRNRRKFSGTL